MTFTVYDLIIETTRRCNAKCGHCLRGEAENMDMKPEYLDALFSKLSAVSTLCFTGGEPSLVPEVIGQALDAAEKYGVSIGNFYIATNAIAISDEFMQVLVRLYCYCDENEISRVDWSNDEYHPQNDTSKLAALAFAGAKYEDGQQTGIIGEGRGADLNADRYLKQYDVPFEIDDGYVSEGNVYLNCEGNIISGCDWSYDSQREPGNIVSTVDDFSIKAIEQYMEGAG